MSRGPYPILLMLAMSLPSAVRALGLGDIRVDSALNEPLSAQIDIVGATRDELIGLAANVANREVFQRYGADRPAFLASATFKVGLDAQGRPVLNVRSADPFTDPLVSFLVDLRWGKNELVREYSLLLDPPGFNANRQVALASTAAPGATGATDGLPRRGDAAPPATAPDTFARHDAATSAAASTPADATQAHPPQIHAMGTLIAAARSDSDATGNARYTIAAGDTLRSIARRAGARTEPEMQRTMLAIFRANPSAFDGNINRMHRGAVLALPPASELAAISITDAKREIRAQMTAWRADGRPATTTHMASASPPVAAPAPVAALAPSAPMPGVVAAQGAASAPAQSAPFLPHTGSGPQATAQAASGPAPTAVPASVAALASTAVPTAAPAVMPDATDAALKNRVQFLEKALDDMHKELAREGANIQDLKEAAARGPVAAKPQTPTSPQPVLATVEPQSASGKSFLGPTALVLGILAAGFAYFRKRMNARSLAETAEPIGFPEHDDAVTSPSAAGKLPVAGQTASGLPARESAALPFAANPSVASAVSATSVSATPAPAKRGDFDDLLGAAPRIKGNNETTVSVEVDAEALERSYLDSLSSEAMPDVAAFEAVAKPATAYDKSESDTMESLDLALQGTGATHGAFAMHDTVAAYDKGAHGMAAQHDPLATLDTVTVDASELGAEFKNSDFDTMVLDMKNAADKVAESKLAATNKLQTISADTELDYNLLDLDATAQHVHMPSDLHDRAQVTERRTNIVDVLKVAIDQDPKRRDLRMKLLETYFSAASTNQRSFLEVVRELKQQRDCLTEDDWKKVMLMGREIAPTDPLFNELMKDDDDLAHCA